MLQKKIAYQVSLKPILKQVRLIRQGLCEHGIVMNQFLIWITSFVLVRKT